MSSNQFRSGFGGAVLTLALLIGVGSAMSTTALAQHRNDRDRRYGYGNDIYRIAQDQGYRDGMDHGAEHARDRQSYNPEGTRHYKDATEGYRSSYGNKDAYKQAYRAGFRRGYDEGFRGNSSTGRYGRGSDPYYRNDPYGRNNGNNGDYRRTDDGDYRRSGDYGGYGRDINRIASEQGYRDGVDHGAEHARENKRFDPEGTRHYKNATEGYRSEYGSKEEYKQAYRDGFRRGYDEGYRRSGRGGNGRRNSRSRAGDILGGILGGRP